MNFIVLDLEWNQSNSGEEEEAARLPFEIIEIGAIKLNDECVMISEFNELIRPVVYQEMHRITSRLIHMQMEELERGRPFAKVAEEFLDWCGDEKMFCTWGGMDLTEFQRNMRYHNMEALADGPIAFLDVQKLFSIAYEDRKTRRALEYAIDYLGIEKDIPFHRAFSDAYYTAKVLTAVVKKDSRILKNVSYDVYTPPKDRSSEIKVQFDTYMKYISRAFADREVVSSKCYLCHRNLRKRVKWFPVHGRNYYCVAYCEKHGYLKGKIRIRRAEEGGFYVVKTTKFITKEEADNLTKRRLHVREIRRKSKDKDSGIMT